MSVADATHGIRIALHDFEADHDDEISFAVGEQVVVLEQDDLYNDGWWQGRNEQGHVGLFPVNFTQPFTPEAPTSASATHSLYVDSKPYADLINNLEINFRDSEFLEDSSLPDLASPPPPAVPKLPFSVTEPTPDSSRNIFNANRVAETPVLDKPLPATPGSDKFPAEEDSLPDEPSLSPAALPTEVADMNLAHLSLEDPPEQWSIEQVAAWLQQQGFGSLAPIFIENEISGDVLLDLNLTTLKELQINTFGKRYHLMNAIIELRDGPNGSGGLMAGMGPGGFAGPTLISPTSQASHHTDEPLSRTISEANSAHSLAPAELPGVALLRSNSHMQVPQRSQSRPPSMLLTPTAWRLAEQSNPPSGSESVSVGSKAPSLRHVNSFGVETGDEPASGESGQSGDGPSPRHSAPASEEDAAAAAAEESRTIKTRADSIRRINDALKRRNTATKAEKDRQRRGPLASLSTASSPSAVAPTELPEPAIESPPNPSPPPPPVSGSPAGRALAMSFSTPSPPPPASDRDDAPVEPHHFAHPSPRGRLDSLGSGMTPIDRPRLASQMSLGSLFRNRSTQKPTSTSPSLQSPRSTKSIDVDRALTELDQTPRRSESPPPVPPPPGPPRADSSPASLAHPPGMVTHSVSPGRPSYAPIQAEFPVTPADAARPGPVAPPQFGKATTYHLQLEDIQSPDHQGYLKKRATGYPLWQTRWFVLKGPNLYYFKTPKDSVCRGIVNLQGYRIVPDENIKKGKYCFKCVHETKRTYYFYHEEASVIRDWIKMLLKATIGSHAPITSSSNINTVPLHVAQSMRPRPPSLGPPHLMGGEATFSDDNGEGDGADEGMLGRSGFYPDAETFEAASSGGTPSAGGGRPSFSRRDSNADGDPWSTEEPSGMTMVQFTQWINHILQHSPYPKTAPVTNLFRDLQDGIVLGRILETLTDEPLAGDTPVESLLAMERIRRCFDRLRSVGVRPDQVAIGCQDIAVGDSMKILTLLTLIRDRFPNSVPGTIFGSSVV